MELLNELYPEALEIDWTEHDGKAPDPAEIAAKMPQERDQAALVAISDGIRRLMTSER
jgi:hypothetical protein